MMTFGNPLSWLHAGDIRGTTRETATVSPCGMPPNPSGFRNVGRDKPGHPKRKSWRLILIAVAVSTPPMMIESHGV